MTQERLRNVELASFCTQCALLFGSGSNIETGLSLVVQSFPALKNSDVLVDFREHHRLSRALSNTQLFDELMVQSLALAEELGREETILEKLAVFYERKQAQRASLWDLLYLPFILFTVLTLLVNVMVWVVLPIFQSIFMQVGGTYPFWLGLMLNGVKIFSIASLIILGLGMVFALWISLRYLQDKRRNDLLDTLLSWMPKTSYLLDLAFFSFEAEICFEVGYQSQSAIGMILNTLAQRKLYKTLKQMKLKETDGLIDLILKSDIYDALETNTLKIAYATGRLDRTMAGVAQRVQRQASSQMEQTLNRLEPIAIGILAISVGSVLVALLLPLLQAMQVLGF
jgi:type IV pilus assembly protein PilC